MEKKLLEYISNFQLVDLLGFGNILQVKECDDFDTYVTNIVVNFSKIKKGKRKQLLKLAKDISDNNCDYDRIKKEER